MVKREEIKGVVFLAQTTYYIYRSEESLQNDEQAYCTTSDVKVFNAHKKQIKNGELKLRKHF